MKKTMVCLMLFTATFAWAQQEIVALYDGPAPGSETWDWEEQFSSKNMFNTELVYNVVEPTLTVFPPATGTVPTGTAVIIAPGGGFHFLSINSEGNEVAEQLTRIGVTAFVLKYRLVHVPGNDPGVAAVASGSNGQYNAIVEPIVPLAMQDGLNAITYVREHAAKYQINPDRIGFMGFSAGGTVTMSVVYNAEAKNRPNFIAPIYAHADAAIGSKVPKEKTPAFIVVASDDQLGLVPNSIDIYNKWKTANQPVEMHIYEKGGHGFGMRKQNIPTDTWLERFGEWLGMHGLLWPEKPEGWYARSSYEGNKKYQAIQEERFQKDWAYLKRYAMDNEAQQPSSDKEKRVVFMGNSITEGWKNADSSFFAGRPYLDRGISGQTTPQMLVRFRQDVIDLNPAVVVILAGINDIAENTGPITLEATFGNIASMAELARANDIEVVLCAVLPAYDFPWRPGLEPAEKVVKLNGMLQAYAKEKDLVYVDYYTPMVDDRQGLKAAYSYDGVHPTLAGYKVMEPLVEAGIKKALNENK